MNSIHRFTGIRQVARRKKHAPPITLAFLCVFTVRIRICQLRINSFSTGSPDIRVSIWLLVVSVADASMSCTIASSRNNSKIKIGIRLKYLTEQSANQPDHLRIEAILICFIKRYVIFIYQDNNQQPAMPAKQFCQYP